MCSPRRLGTPPILLLICAAVLAVAPVVTCLVTPTAALAAPVPGWTAEALTDDGVLQAAPRVWGDYVVWLATGRGGDQEILLHHVPSGTGSNISSQAGDDVSPSIADGVVVWHWHDGHDWEIVSYDIATRTKRQVTNNAHHGRHPHSSGRWVVFTSTVPVVGEEVYLYNVETRVTTRLTTNTVEDTGAWVQDGYPWSDGLVAWHQWDGHDWEIVYRKIGSPYGGRLTDNDYDDGMPVVGGAWIVWEGEPGSDSELFGANVYEGIAGLQLTDDGFDDSNPSVEAGKLVWMKDLEPDVTPDLFTIDLRFKTFARLTDDDTWDQAVSLNLWRAHWTRGHTFADTEIMLQQLLGGPAGTLSGTLPGSLASELDAGVAVWTFHDGHDWEIGMARASFPFTDVRDTLPCREAVENLTLMGVVAGRTAATFEPSSLLYRQQYAKMAVLGIGAPVSEDDVCTFEDVEISGPISLFPDNYIAAAKRFGLVLGTTASTFAPYDNVTRAQAITIAVRAAGEHASGTLAKVPPGWAGLTTWYRDPTHGHNVHAAEYNHLLDGIDLGDWNPDAFCRRGEAAQIIWNLWKRLAAPGRNVAADATEAELLGAAIAGGGCVAVEFDIVEPLVHGDWAGVVVNSPEAGIGRALLHRVAGDWEVVDFGTGYSREDWLAAGAPEMIANYLAAF